MNSDTKAQVLPSFTVIPSNMYVERDADRQLLANLAQMERPAYVLVSRQMGKTNLLLHTKELVQNENVIVVYVDLSTGIEDERDCFRKIIDSTIESHADAFSQAWEGISASRKEPRSPAREYEAELRSLLRVFGGKLIIILDEIDSLTNALFSDRVFGHIRSIYFSRATFSEYRRLTYVLSGVVEPNDIIKDKTISPFNIGEKIYLDDFSLEEVNVFINKTGLQFSTEVVSRIFYWTGGNPRMTWDLCSAVSGTKSTAQNIETVDLCVQRLYLDDFQHAPVDHIRQLVGENSELRTAVWELCSGNLDKIGSVDRTRLYLAGITKSVAQSETPSFKNEIIKRSLDFRWLEEVALGEKALLGMAEHKYFLGDYEDALTLFEKYITMVGGEGDLVSASTWEAMGRSALVLKRYSDGIKYNSKGLACISESDPLIWPLKYILGECALNIGDHELAEDVFSYFLSSSEVNSLSLRGLVNLMGVYLHKGGEESLLKIVDVYSTFCSRFEKVFEGSISQLEMRSLQGWALFNYGIALSRLKRESDAFAAFEKAAQVVSDESLPRVKLRMAASAENDEVKQKTLADTVDYLIRNPLRFEKSDFDNPLIFDRATSITLLAEVASNGLDAEVQRLSEHLVKYYGERFEFDIAGLLLEVGIRLVGLKRKRYATSILERAIAAAGDSNLQLLEAYRWLVWSSRNRRHFDKYLTFLKAGQTAQNLEVIDFNNFSFFASQFMKEKNWLAVLQITKVADSYREGVQEKLKRNYIALDSLALICWDHLGLGAPLREVAQRASQFMEQLPGQFADEVVFFSPEDMREAVRITQSYASFPPSAFTANENGHTQSLTKKRGRNDRVNLRYVDGRIIRAVKYKHALIDLEAGRCQIIEE